MSGEALVDRKLPACCSPVKNKKSFPCTRQADPLQNGFETVSYIISISAWFAAMSFVPFGNHPMYSFT